jgi:hypothetical protein
MPTKRREQLLDQLGRQRERVAIGRVEVGRRFVRRRLAFGWSIGSNASVGCIRGVGRRLFTV